MSFFKAAQTHFRSRRNVALSRLIQAIPAPVTVLDVGGSPFFWDTVGAANRCDVTLLNSDVAATGRDFRIGRFAAYRRVTGDARDMTEYGDQSIDLVVSNSVIEHVGNWDDVKAACSELRRIGKHGWVQTPAAGFPIDPHLRLPLIHYLSPALQAELLRYMPAWWSDTGWHTVRDIEAARTRLAGYNLLSKREMRHLFRGCDIRTERFLLMPKSYVAVW